MNSELGFTKAEETAALGKFGTEEGITFGELLLHLPMDIGNPLEKALGTSKDICGNWGCDIGHLFLSPYGIIIRGEEGGCIGASQWMGGRVPLPSLRLICPFRFLHQF
jgi:hypothetical protein